MNITQIHQPIGYVAPVSHHSVEENGTKDTEILSVSNSTPSKDSFAKGQEAPSHDPEKLVMKPSPISLEERMNQVISAEQMKDLLSMITRVPVIKSENPTHKLDVLR